MWAGLDNNRPTDIGLLHSADLSISSDLDLASFHEGKTSVVFVLPPLTAVRVENHAKHD